MKLICRIFISACLIVFAFACNSMDDHEKNKKIIDDFFHSLDGTWKQDGKDNYEKWETSDNTFRGTGFSIQNGDTVIAENIDIIIATDGIFYRVTVVDQNNQQPVDFKLKSAAKLSLVFENLTHDFPQTITYELLEKDQLSAKISGFVEGELRTIEFHYRRQ